MRHNVCVNNDAASAANHTTCSLLPVPRLSPDTQITLRELSERIGERGHAAIWAENYFARNHALPTCSQIVIGLHEDLGINVSARSAERALRDIRNRPCEVRT